MKIKLITKDYRPEDLTFESNELPKPTDVIHFKHLPNRKFKILDTPREWVVQFDGVLVILLDAEKVI